MKRITTRFIQACICVAFLANILVQDFAEAQVIVGHPCEIRPNINSSNTGIGHHRYVVDANGINQGDYAVDLNSSHCANDRIIAPISGRISFSRGPRFYNEPGRLSCIVAGRYVGVPDENGEIRNTILRIDGDDGVSVKLLHGHRGNFREGQRVNVGDVIGTIGSIGCSTGNHIHIEVRQHGSIKYHHQWDFGNPSPPPPAPPADYLQLTSFIRGHNDREMCIDVGGNGRYNGNNIQLYACNDTTAQKYYFDNSDGTIRLYDDPLWCLDVDHRRFQNGTNIHLWECNNSPAQHFLYDARSNQLRVAASPGLCLDVHNASNQNGTNIKLWECRNNNPAQQFYLARKISRIKATWLRGERGQNMCVDINGSRFTFGNNVHFWECNGTNAQRFFYDNRTGNIFPTEEPGMCLDVAGGNLNGGINIQLWGCNRTAAQNFRYDSYSRFLQLGERSQTCMDVSGSGNRNGTNIQTWECNSTNAQRFNLE